MNAGTGGILTTAETFQESLKADKKIKIYPLMRSTFKMISRI
jgi:hypothetical protein